MAASSSSHSTLGSREPLLGSSPHLPAHDIFLSYNDAQKAFVDSLHQRLVEQYTTFVDIEHHSLPSGEPFPSHIFCAIQTCRLAVVVFSEEYVQSKWPMLELCACLAAATAESKTLPATPKPKILPLFLKLSAGGLKQKGNLDKWFSAWQKFAEEDFSINVSTWGSVLKKVSSYNGLKPDKHEEESAYIERVFSGICRMVDPFRSYNLYGIHGIHRLSKIVLDKFEALHSEPSKVCVLGMYGLPGSGKSTICRYLCECLFSQFAGKTFYLELLTHAKNKEFLIMFKELLEQRTNFNNKVDLKFVSDFGEVYGLLKGTDFVRSRVFLVLDNILSQESRNVVKKLLQLGLAEGSKVLLVAHSIDVLCPLLEDEESHQTSHYVYGSMSVPGINKEEALQILLRSGDDVPLPDSSVPEAALIQRDKQIMEEVVNMFGFSNDHGSTSYLPLALKMMGKQLQEHELNVETWNRSMKSLQIEFGLCMQEVLKQMALKSFETLPSSRLRDLFLDVALFIVPLSYSDGESPKLDEACSHLSLIHCCKSEEIEFELLKLQQYGFLTIWKGTVSTPTVSVHDFYLELAASIEEASKYYWSCGHRWSKIQHNQAIEMVCTTQLELRTVVLELDEGYEHFEFSLGFSRVRAMVLRNCKSLKTLQGFANLKSLVSLEIRNCPSLKWVEPPATGHRWPYVQRFEWVSQDNRNQYVDQMQEQQQQEISSSKKPIWRLFWQNLSQIGFKRSRMIADGLLFQMKGLQILRLENSGILQYVDIRGCLPQLRMLEVRERHIKRLRICNLPKLERFVFFGDAKPSCSRDIGCCSDVLSCDHYDWQVSDSLVPKTKALLGKEFLAGCPNLQAVYMQCVAFENEASHITIASSHLRQLRLNGLWNMSQLPDLDASLESLEELLLSQCRELRSLYLGCTFRNLQGLYLGGCHNLTEVCGFDGLPMLRRLNVCNCRSLKILKGLSVLVSLQEIKVCMCPNLQGFLLPDLESLIKLRQIVYDGPHNFNGTWDVRKLVNLTSINVDLSSGKLTGVECLERLEVLQLESQTPDSGHTSTLVDLTSLLGIMTMCCFSLRQLCLYRLGNLRSLKGIEFLRSLKHLSLRFVQNLSCWQGIECLGELQHLDAQGCASVEEMPPLSTLVKLQELWLWDCKNLRSVEGCDELDQLQVLWLKGCKSLAHFPLDLRNWKSSVYSVTIEGCKFANGEAVVAWAKDEKVPEPLRHASLRALRWELSNIDSKATSEMLVDRVVQEVLNRRAHIKEECERDICDNDDKYVDVEEGDDDGNYDEDILVAQISWLAKDFDCHNCTNREIYDRVWASSEVLDEGLRCFVKLPKQRLMGLCQSDAHFSHFLYYLFHHLCNLLKLPCYQD